MAHGGGGANTFLMQVLGGGEAFFHGHKGGGEAFFHGHRGGGEEIFSAKIISYYAPRNAAKYVTRVAKKSFWNRSFKYNKLFLFLLHTTF